MSRGGWRLVSAQAPVGHHSLPPPQIPAPRLPLRQEGQQALHAETPGKLGGVPAGPAHALSTARLATPGGQPVMCWCGRFWSAG